MAQSIRHEGENAKKRFRQLIPSSGQSLELTPDDTKVNVNGVWYSVEVKECRANTINQVRAIKYLPLIIYDGGIWYVIPPHEVVRLVSLKSRGQHTEIPFECANLTLSQLPTHLQCQDDQLADRVSWAIREGQRYSSIKEAMEELLSNLIKLNEKTKFRISEILEQYK